MLITLLAAAGITFAIQHKIPFIHKKSKFIDSMLSCTYCTGFHGGWIAYLLQGNPSILEGIAYAFSGAIFSYALDELIKYLEEAHGDESN